MTEKYELTKEITGTLIKGMLFSPDEVKEKQRRAKYFHSVGKGCKIEGGILECKRRNKVFYT